jgi:hypothetical protein
MTSPDALTGDFAEDVFRRKAKKFIFQKHILWASEQKNLKTSKLECVGVRELNNYGKLNS